MPAEGFVGRETIQQLLGVSRGGLYLMIREGRFPAPDYRIQHKGRWNVITVRTWFRKHQGGGTRRGRSGGPAAETGKEA